LPEVDVEISRGKEKSRVKVPPAGARLIETLKIEKRTAEPSAVR
jgi:hypothetical protein